MPKRPPRPPRASSAKSSVTPASSLTEILRAEVKTRLEILRRQAFADLQALEAQLVEIPPAPPQDPRPANEG
jgi:hypothetical protein